MNIAFIGVGKVGAPLADHLQQLGHEVAIATSNPQSDSVQAAVARNPSLQVKSPIAAINHAAVIFLATPYAAIESALTDLAESLAGKILVDCTNPVGPGLTHSLNSKLSGAETIQKLAPANQVVKAFTIYGYENLENNHYPGYGDLKPAMLLAGNDPTAKQTIAQLATQLGWEPVDVGDLTMSLHLEHMTLLWISMARVQGQGANFVWARLQR